MRKIIINSDVSAEAAALLCAHLQNVQTHSVVITDSATFLHYGEEVNIDTDKSTIELYARKFNDVYIIYIPDIVSVHTSAELLQLVNDVITFIAETTIEQVENAVLYFGSTLLSDEILRELSTTTESTYVRLVNFKSTEKLENKFTWIENESDEHEAANIYQYTILFNKKYAKQAAKFKRPVLLITEKDVLAILEATRQEKFVSTGAIKNTAIAICAAQLNVPEKSVESWLTKQL